MALVRSSLRLPATSPLNKQFRIIIMLSHRLALTIFLTLCHIPLARSQETPQAQLSNLLRQMNTMSATVQQLIESDGALLEESSIQMHVMRPGGFYWETLEPFPELVVTNGTVLWNYQPDLEQVVIENWDSSRAELAAELLGGRTDGWPRNMKSTSKMLVRTWLSFSYSRLTKIHCIVV